MKKIPALLGVLLLALAAYLALWPVPIEPVAWSAPVSPGYTGPFAANTRLAGLTLIPLGGEEGPEHVARGPDDKIYLSTASGAILRIGPDGSGLETFARTGGRVLGFDFDASGRLIAADAMKGLLAITPDGAIEILADKGPDGRPLLFADAVAVAPNGAILFSDASARFGPADWGGTLPAAILDLLEASCTGRILAYDPETRATHLAAKGLCFANGVALSEGGDSLFIAETGKYRIWRIPAHARDLDLSRGPTAEARVILDNLPGSPDNLMRGANGRLWVGFTKPRSAPVDGLSDNPNVRKVIVRLPRALWPVPKPYGHVIAFAEDGRVLADLQDPSGAYPETTGATEVDGRLYVQSLHAKTLGWLPLEGLDL